MSHRRQDPQRQFRHALTMMGLLVGCVLAWAAMLWPMRWLVGQLAGVPGMVP